MHGPMICDPLIFSYIVVKTFVRNYYNLYEWVLSGTSYTYKIEH